MSINSLFSFIGAIISLYLGIKTLLKDKKNNVNIIFSLFCISMFIYTFSLSIIYLLKTEKQVVFGMNFNFIGMHTFLPILFHFILIITKIKTKRWILLLNYLPSLIFITANISGISLFSGYVKFRGEWTGIINVRVYAFYLLHIIIFLTISFVLIIKWGKRTVLNKEKIYSKFLLVSTLLTYLICQTFGFILPIFEIYDLQFIAIITFFLFISGLYFLISKFRFLNLNYSILADEILSNINDMVIILDREFRIINVNQKFTDNFSIIPDNIKNTSYFDLMPEDDKLRYDLNNILELKTGSFNHRINYIKNDEYILTNSYISGIKDKFNDLTGFLVVSSEIKEIRQFRKYFKITNRELEIIEAIISGLTYKEVSETMKISERTVESHLTNIYNKLGINNKIELVKVTGEFNIKPNSNK